MNKHLKCYPKEDADNSSISFNIDGKEYNYDKVIEILKKHKPKKIKSIISVKDVVLDICKITRLIW